MEKTHRSGSFLNATYLLSKALDKFDALNYTYNENSSCFQKHAP